MGQPLRFGQALGNRFLLVDYRIIATPKVTPEQWIAFANHTGQRIDQLIEIHPSDSADNRLAFYNQDASPAEACGNGTRCAALWLMESAQKNQQIWKLATAGGLLTAQVKDQQNIMITFPPPQYETLANFPIDLPLLAPADVVTIGNPHLILWLAADTAVDIHHWGPALEQSPHFPERINVSFAVCKDKTTLSLKVWERGAGATQACGTAASATHVSARIRGFVETTSCVQQIGGALTIHWPGPKHSLALTGSASLDPIIFV